MEQAAGVQAARGPRAGLVHLRPADRQRRDVQCHGRSREAIRRHVCAVRDADAVPGDGGLQQLGETQRGCGPDRVDGVPITRYWLIPSASRPKIYMPHPSMNPAQIRAGTQEAWARALDKLPAVWERSSCVRSLRARLVFVVISKLYRQDGTRTPGSPRIAHESRGRPNAPGCSARGVRHFFIAAPMPPPAGTGSAGGARAHGLRCARCRPGRLEICVADECRALERFWKGTPWPTNESRLRTPVIPARHPDERLSRGDALGLCAMRACASSRPSNVRSRLLRGDDWPGLFRRLGGAIRLEY